MQFFALIAFVAMLASQVLALNISIPPLGNITADQFLDVTDQTAKNNCETQCDGGNRAIAACAGDDGCLCSSATVTAVTTCQQCMFTDLIHRFATSQDPRVGSTAALGAYVKACTTSGHPVDAKEAVLVPPPDWNGPFGQGLNTATTVVGVAFATLIGLGCIWTVNSMVAMLLVILAVDQHLLFTVFVAHLLAEQHYPASLALRSSLSTCRSPAILRPSNLTRYIHHSTQSTKNNCLPLSSPPPSSSHSHVAPTCPHCESGHDTPPRTRFNWRARATSRLAPHHPLLSRKTRRKWPKRTQPPQEVLSPGDPFYEEIQAYQGHFLELLKAEQDEDETVLRERLSSWSVDRLRQEGYCITGLGAYWLEANQFGRPVASFGLGPGIALPEHRFDNGTQVLVTRLDPLKEEPLRGSVVSCTKTQLKVSFEERFGLDDGHWRLDVGRSSIVFDRMRAAINRLSSDPMSQESSPHADASDREYILQGTHLRDILLRSFRPSHDSEIENPSLITDEPRGTDPTRPGEGIFSADMRIQSWARRYSLKDPLVVEGDPVLSGLNATQIRAVAMMLNERFTLVQGPPGTGKTKTIIEAVKLLKAHFEVPQPILLCTYTNVAVDNLVEGLVSAGLKPLRVGYGGKVKDALMEHTLENKLKAHPMAAKLEELAKQADDLERKQKDLVMRIVEFRGKATSAKAKERLSNMENAAISMEKQWIALKGKAYGMYQGLLRDTVHGADVVSSLIISYLQSVLNDVLQVCTTCITSASVQLNVSDFPIVFIDEASMSTEPATLIPLMKGSQHVALIGDHKQLPPVITSPEAQAKGLGISLFERLAEEGAVPSIMLDIQYRMHPRISHFPSHEFYNFSLRDGTVNASGVVQAHLQPPNTSLLELAPSGTAGPGPSVVFLHHNGEESMKDRSRVNVPEVHIVCSVIEDLLLHNPHLLGTNIGIIAPYVAQISLLNRMLNMDTAYQKRFQTVLGSHRALQLPLIEIKTVDGFEGREKDVIVFSTVRNNASGHIGFLADRRRLNVGLTRAKRGLVMVGNIETLRTARSKARVGAGVEVLGDMMESLSPAKTGKGADAWKRYTKYLDEEKLIVRLDGPGDPLRKVLYGNLPGNGHGYGQVLDA
ncbi:P-loop containing nucleoside triphosphate hydrolase protein [Cristinia sonorae]|uniref:P-loop containing nucleoside triphosphate hydrolase protein n=1 Tax=Cristinia sonorae TaxID=1940300 RepID=A0A8K0UFH2_9AGAR|nr:P-loop containing nucleoside triphosphate hydrolase protein [Cristinia sonorae]